MFSGRWTLQPEADGCYFIDRNPCAFHYVLDFLRGEPIDQATVEPSKLQALIRDAEFYNLVPLLDQLTGLNDCFADHSSAIVLSEANKVATLQDLGCNQYVLGKNRYSGKDHVVIR